MGDTIMIDVVRTLYNKKTSRQTLALKMDVAPVTIYVGASGSATGSVLILVSMESKNSRSEIFECHVRAEQE